MQRIKMHPTHRRCQNLQAVVTIGGGRGGVCVHTDLRRHRFPVVQPPEHLPTSTSCRKLATQRDRERGSQYTAGCKYWPTLSRGAAAAWRVKGAFIRHHLCLLAPIWHLVQRIIRKPKPKLKKTENVINYCFLF